MPINFPWTENILKWGEFFPFFSPFFLVKSFRVKNKKISFWSNPRRQFLFFGVFLFLLFPLCFSVFLLFSSFDPLFFSFSVLLPNCTLVFQYSSLSLYSSVLVFVIFYRRSVLLCSILFYIFRRNSIAILLFHLCSWLIAKVIIISSAMNCRFIAMKNLLVLNLFLWPSLRRQWESSLKNLNGLLIHVSWINFQFKRLLQLIYIISWLLPVSFSRVPMPKGNDDWLEFYKLV